MFSLFAGGYPLPKTQELLKQLTSPPSLQSLGVWEADLFGFLFPLWDGGQGDNPGRLELDLFQGP